MASKKINKFKMLLLLLVAGGALALAAFVFIYQGWIKKPVSTEILKAERAFADGNLIALGHVDVERLSWLLRTRFGEFDPSSLRMTDTSSDLLSNLFSGTPQLSHNLYDGLFTLHESSKDSGVVSSLFLRGNFEASKIIETLGSHYEIRELGSERWQLSKKAGLVSDTDCEEHTMGKEPVPLTLRLTSQLGLLTNDESHNDHLWKRFSEGSSQEQELSTWQNYRGERLASATIFNPEQAAQGLSGITGLIAKQAFKEAPSINSIALGLSLGSLMSDFLVNLKIGSSDASWNQESAASFRQSVNELKSDSKSVTPSLASILSRLNVSGSPNDLSIELRLDSGLLSELDQTIQDALGQFFGGSMSAANPTSEQIDKNPKNYTKNRVLASLPALKIKDYQRQPLFHQGAFAVDLQSIKRNKEELYELQFQGKIGLPKSDNFGRDLAGKATLQIESVLDQQGQELLRDERCVKERPFSGKNEEPSASTHLGSESMMISKLVRLKPGSALQSIDRVKGSIGFSAPVEVVGHSIELLAGESVEDSGVRFYLNSAKPSSVTYQLSGDKKRFVEVRGLNKAGKPLRKGWRMGDQNSGRVTQGFNGEVAALEVYIAKDFNTQEMRFELSDLMSVQDSKSRRPNKITAPNVKPEQWDKYNRLDLGKLETSPKDWVMSARNKSPVAALSKAPIKMFITHTPRQWGNDPYLHLYFPMIEELAGVLSALSYSIEEPAKKDSPQVYFENISYPYYTKSGEVVVKHRINEFPFALRSLSLKTGLQKNEKLARLKGWLRFSLPTETKSIRLEPDELWTGKDHDGVKITLTSIDRGMFPGYGLKIEGALDKLVNVHGVKEDGKPISAYPINYQSQGYWTMKIPFQGVSHFKLVIATKQKVVRYPFDFKPQYD